MKRKVVRALTQREDGLWTREELAKRIQDEAIVCHRRKTNPNDRSATRDYLACLALYYKVMFEGETRAVNRLEDRGMKLLVNQTIDSWEEEAIRANLETTAIGVKHTS